MATEPRIASQPAPGGQSADDSAAAEQDKDIAGQAQDKAGQLADQAQETAQQALGQARSRVRSEIDQRSTQAAEQIGEQASDLRTVSQTLREQGKQGPADVADRLVKYAEQVSGYLRERDADRLLNDAEDFGRRRPWAAAGAGMAVGFAASRFLKASSRQRYSARAGAGRTPALPAATPAGAGSVASPGPAGAPSAPTAAPAPAPGNGGPMTSGHMPEAL
jgi:ElaB/YqjD/DUF883 family membrane-anchored ribosome-binding protein